MNTNTFQGKIKILRKAFQGYGLKIALLSFLGLIGGLFEGIGINVLIPIISFITNEERGTDFITRSVEKIFMYFNIAFSLTNLFVLVFVLFLLKAIIKVIFNYIKILISTEYEQSVGSELLAKTLRARWQYLSGQKIGHLQNVIMTDVHFGALTLEFIGTIIMILSSLVVYLAIAVNISGPTTALALFFGLIIFFATRPLMERSRKLSAKTARLNKQVSHFINEVILGMKSIKISSAGDSILNQGASFFKDLRHLRIKTNLIRSNTTAFIEPVGMFFIMLIFLFLYKSGSFVLASFLVIMYLVERIFTYTNQLQTTVHKIYGSLPYLEQVVAYERENEEEEEPDRGTQAFSFKKELTLGNLTFSYTTDRPVFRSLTLTIRCGETVGVIGPSGVGKTTLVDLVLRLLHPVEGKILLDGVPVQNISLTEWRKRVGYVAQEPFLINGSVKDNIRFFDSAISDKLIDEAAEKAYIKGAIENMPHRYETIVGERGVELSAGQRQRIAIARVLARNPDILILDEATSALDNESESYIQKTLDGLRGRVTMIIIAHRLSTIANCDRVIALSDGKILEDGSPKDLAQKKGGYLYRMTHIHSPKEQI